MQPFDAPCNEREHHERDHAADEYRLAARDGVAQVLDARGHAREEQHGHELEQCAPDRVRVVGLGQGMHRAKNGDMLLFRLAKSRLPPAAPLAGASRQAPARPEKRSMFPFSWRTNAAW